MKKIFLYLALLGAAGTSCKDQLDLEPLAYQSDPTFWLTANDFKTAANDFYPYLKSFAEYVPSLEDDRSSDLAAARTAVNAGNYVQDQNHNVWNDAYSQFRNINYLLMKAATYGKPDEIKQYVAEARFFRAYGYFRLYRYYGGVPLVLKPLDVNSPELQAPRNSREEVFNQIMADLDAAQADIPLEAQIPGLDKGRVSKQAVQAFIARVNLFEGTWHKFRSQDGNAQLDRAISAAQSVMQTNQYRMFTALADSSYRYLFILENEKSNPASLTKAANQEYILVNRYDFNLRKLNLNVSHTGVGSPTQKLAGMYLCRDGLPIDRSPLFRGYATFAAEFQNRDLRMTNSMKVPGRRYWDYGPNARWDNTSSPTFPGTVFFPNIGSQLSGYDGLKFRTERGYLSNNEGFDYPVIRLPEVLLAYAEAKFERNGNISDADLDLTVNVIRTRTRLPRLTNAFVSANNLDMRTEIRRERTVELAYEGFRLDDLKRWKTAEVEMPKSLLGIKYQGTQYETDPRTSALRNTAQFENGFLVVEPAGQRVFPERNYLYPLPSQQIQLNPQLVQNPGW